MVLGWLNFSINAYSEITVHLAAWSDEFGFLHMADEVI